MLRHKREIKKRYMSGYWMFFGKCENWNVFEEYYINKWNEKPEYWKQYYLSGPRQYAKDLTNRKVRQMYRNVREDQFEDLWAPQGNDYTKIGEYDWIIW